MRYNDPLFCKDSSQMVKGDEEKQGENTPVKVAHSTHLTPQPHPPVSSNTMLYKHQSFSADYNGKDSDNEINSDYEKYKEQNSVDKNFELKMEPGIEHCQVRGRASWQHQGHSSLAWSSMSSVSLNPGRNGLHELDHGQKDTNRCDQNRLELSGNPLGHCRNCSWEDGSSSEHDRNLIGHGGNPLQLCRNDKSWSEFDSTLENKDISSWRGSISSYDGCTQSVHAGTGQSQMSWPSEKSSDADNHNRNDDDLFQTSACINAHHQVSTKEQHSQCPVEEEEEEEMEEEEEEDVPVDEEYATASFSTSTYRAKLRESAHPPHKKANVTAPVSTALLSLSTSSMKVTSSRAPQVERLYECPHCVATFVDANNLKRHLSYIHTDKPGKEEKCSKGGVRCEECGKTFTRPSRLERHKLIHTGEKPFVCNVCNKAFSQAGNLKTHQILHTGRKPFVCDVCHKAFSDSGNLKKHQVIHTGDKPFVCDICDKAFVETGHLKRHKKIHTGDKPYACDVCGKAFIEAGTLRRHKVQTNHNPIICFVCNRNFLLPEHLEEHRKVHIQPGDAAGNEKTGSKP